ncbi:hypothetical protein H9Y04_04815 [Streptomyces sp. TRM66268-LWL]|uniref:Aromatic ring-opening dioxygenase LigA n=1 Tax=Streptomyces polyasparticus TaxID=2767826 RepID=A0ABR7S8U1_9ACTN|nr:hypothetical protein [Streptomyces polyasparticus]MBC9711891.1 hypothetical protein [Streptomyces polyasparticus]
MTTPPLVQSLARPTTLSPARRILRLLAIVSCLPYLTLKVAWILGSHVGIPDGSSLLEHRTTMVVANTVTVLMDACVIVLALLLTRPWGLRVRAWLLLVPVWVASGLLAPIMTGFPVQLLVKAVGGSVQKPSASEPFLDEWVFGVVYGGFILQGIALGGLFVLYARQRWGHLWHGTVGEVALPVSRLLALSATAVALLPAAVHLMWAFGSTAGLSADLVRDRAADTAALDVLHALYPLVAAAGALVIAFRTFPRLPVAVPLAVAWVGSGATGCWGAWLAVASLTATEIAERPTGLVLLTYAGQMIAGLLVLTLTVRFFRARSAATGSTSVLV